MQHCYVAVLYYTMISDMYNMSKNFISPVYNSSMTSLLCNTPIRLLEHLMLNNSHRYLRGITCHITPAHNLADVQVVSQLLM